ncbi:hypothetical protein ONZ45_g11141 [Pleurotus djamor]|nr:hypothetical protein ONZ45_g11141 [Pleurotus djamor]
MRVHASKTTPWYSKPPEAYFGLVVTELEAANGSLNFLLSIRQLKSSSSIPPTVHLNARARRNHAHFPSHGGIEADQHRLSQKDDNPPTKSVPVDEQKRLRDALFKPSGTGCTHLTFKKGCRNLIINIDGTSNQFSEYSTNIVEMFSRIIKDFDEGEEIEQLVFYNSGIGTYARPSFRSLHYLKQVIINHIDTAIAWNFERIIHAAYKWLSENYRRGDRIFLFGFSRGAYQVRVIAGMIERVGLLHKGNENQIAFAYELYASLVKHSRRETPKSSSATQEHAAPSKTREDQLCEQFKNSLCHKNVKVHFVGVWDTVSSIGVFRGKSLPETVSGMSHVCHFRHALALDERRAKFQPEYVNGGLGPQPGQPGDVKEVWFAGTHSDIGGGNVENRSLNNFGEWKTVTSKESLTPLWRILECLPFGALSYKDENSLTWRPHFGRPRKIKPGQRIHQSVFSDSNEATMQTRLGRPDNLVNDGNESTSSTPCIIASNGTTSPEEVSLNGSKSNPSYCPKAVLDVSFGSSSWTQLFSQRSNPKDPVVADWIEPDPFENALHVLTSLLDTCEQPDFGTAHVSLSANKLTADMQALEVFLDNESRLVSLLEVRNAGLTLLKVVAALAGHPTVEIPQKSKETLIRLLSRILQDSEAPPVAESPHLPVSQVYQWGSKIRQYRDEFIKVLQPFACLGNMRANHYIFGVAFASVDPLQIVFTDSPDATTSVLIWDGSTRPPKDVARVVQGGYSIVSRDGSHIAVRDGKDVRLIDTTAQPPSTTECTDDEDPNDSGDMWSLCFSADNHTLATGHRNGWIKLWRREGDQWKVVKRFKGGDWGISDLAFSRDGTRLAFNAGPFIIKVWDLADDAVIELEDYGISRSLAWSPSGDWIVSGTMYRSVKIWSADRGKITHTFEAHDNTIQCLAFRDDGQVLATGSDDHRIRIWRCGTWEKIWEFDIGEPVCSLAFSPDGKRLVSGGRYGAVHLWDVDMGDEEPVD